MTNRPQLRNKRRADTSKLLRHAIFATIAVSLAGCSDDKAEPTPDPVGTPDAGGDTDAVVGTFAVTVTPAAGDVAAKAGLVGKVYDGQNPAPVSWVDGISADGCVLRTPKVPFCDPGCGADVCVEDGVCLPNAAALSVGDVRVQGLATVGGEVDFVLKPTALTYTAVGATKLAYPPFAEGDTVRIEAAGGSSAPFAIEATAIAPIEVSGDTPQLDSGQPFRVTWVPPRDPSRSSVDVVLNISHHGGTSGRVECSVPDNGALTIPAALVTGLVDIGVSGWPSVKLTRLTRGTTQIAWGVVELEISSDYDRPISIAGLESCDLPEDCASGVCRDDRTCG